MKLGEVRPGRVAARAACRAPIALRMVACLALLVGAASAQADVSAIPQPIPGTPGGVAASLIASGVAAQEMASAELRTTQAAARKSAEDQESENEPSRAKATAAEKAKRSPAGGDAAAPGAAHEGAAGSGPKTLPLGDRLELTAGTNGLFSFSDTSTQISLFAEARYRLSAMWQLGGSFAYRYQSSSGGTSDSALQALVGPTFNLPVGEDGGLQNSFFISPKVGVTTGQTSFNSVVVNSNTQFTLALTAGKRFAFSKSIAYAPSVGVVKESNFSPNFTIQPISISIFF